MTLKQGSQETVVDELSEITNLVHAIPKQFRKDLLAASLGLPNRDDLKKTWIVSRIQRGIELAGDRREMVKIPSAAASRWSQDRLLRVDRQFAYLAKTDDWSTLRELLHQLLKELANTTVEVRVDD